MPKLGLTMEAGTIVRWLVEAGTEVAAGQPVLVIETDKVESEVESPQAGLLHPVGEVGREYPCGAGIGWFVGDGEQPPAGLPSSSAATSAVPAVGTSPVAVSPVAVSTTSATTPNGARAAVGEYGRLLASPNARRLAAERGVDLWTVVGTGPDGRITSEDVPSAPPAVAPRPPAARPLQAPSATSAGAGALASVAARNLADLLGLDLAEIAPSGPEPKVSRDDVAAHARALMARGLEASRPAGAPAPVLQTPSSFIPLTGMRGVIAERMQASLDGSAQLTLTMDVDMDGVIADRDRRKETAGDGDPVPSFTDYVIAAAAQALVEHPYVNSQVTADGVALLPAVHVGMAVAVDDGLLVPVIHNTLGHDLPALAAETRRLATAASDGTLTLGEMEGGTFSVTALGMFGVDAFTPILNTPNTAILGVGRLRDDVAWTDDGQPAKVTRLTLSLTWDHRAFDGAPAARFAASIKRRLEAHR